MNSLYCPEYWWKKFPGIEEKFVQYCLGNFLQRKEEWCHHANTTCEGFLHRVSRWDHNQSFKGFFSLLKGGHHMLQSSLWLNCTELQRVLYPSSMFYFKQWTSLCHMNGSKNSILRLPPLVVLRKRKRNWITNEKLPRLHFSFVNDETEIHFHRNEN